MCDTVAKSASALVEIAWPPEVDFILSALEAGPRPASERQRLVRLTHRVIAQLSLFSAQNDLPPDVLYVRHVNVQALGFLTNRQLPLSHGGLLRVPSLQGRTLAIYCTVLRCRPAAPGWFEGAVYFNRPQNAFAPSQPGAAVVRALQESTI